MKKYLQIIKGTWEEYMTYRLSFFLWRVRMVLQLLVTYFLWIAIFTDKKELFGYSQAMILTYILLSSLMRTLIMGTRTQDVGMMINTGDISNWLIRPIYFQRYNISREIADKALNFLFSIGEVLVLYVVLRPQIFIQGNAGVIFATVFATLVGMVIFFYFSMILSYLAFWTQDIWAPRFFSFIFIEFFGGMLYPLDILPTPLYLLTKILPFSYFIYFPLKVYLGQLTLPEVLQGFSIGLFWVFALYLSASALWRKGLRLYTAEGR